MNAAEGHILNGNRPEGAADDGQMEQFLGRNGAFDNDPETLRRKHQEGMSKKAHSICCKGHNNPMVRLLLYKNLNSDQTISIYSHQILKNSKIRMS